MKIVLPPASLEGRDYVDDNQISDEAIPYWARLGESIDTEELIVNSKELFDLEISRRNAHRIMSQEIRPLESIDLGQLKEGRVARDKPDIFTSDNNLTKNILIEDIEEFTQAIKQKFRVIEEKYFIKLQNEPEVKSGKRKITISLSLTTDDNNNL